MKLKEISKKCKHDKKKLRNAQINAENHSVRLRKLGTKWNKAEKCIGLCE